MISVMLSYGLPFSSGGGELSLGVNTDLNCSVRSLAFVLLSGIRELPSFSGETSKFSWHLDLTYDQNGLELLDIYAGPSWMVLLTLYIYIYAHSALRSWRQHSFWKFL